MFMAKSTVNLQFSIANCQPLTEGTLNPLAHESQKVALTNLEDSAKIPRNPSICNNPNVWIVGFSVFESHRIPQKVVKLLVSIPMFDG